MSDLADRKVFAALCERTVEVPLAVALARNGVSTVLSFLAQRGMNAEAASEAGLTSILTKCKALDNSIDLDLDKGDSDGLRALHILCRNVKVISSIVAGEAEAPAAGTAAEEAANATKAVGLYQRLTSTQGIKVPQKWQLDYALVSQMDNLQHKNGTINRRIGLANIVAQCKKKKSERDLGMGLKFSLEEDDAEEKYKYNEVTLMLRCFYTALAAILSYEVDPNADREGEVPVMASDGSGKMCVAGTLNACYDLMFETVRAIGLYPLRHADSIFRSSFERVMDLSSKHHFDRAVEIAVEYHPSAFRPTEEELREAEQSSRQATPRSVGQKTKRPGEAAPTPKQKKVIDATKPPCHGMAYHGMCNKPNCQFDHHEKRCQAFKEANPDGPPGRK